MIGSSHKRCSLIDYYFEKTMNLIVILWKLAVLNDFFLLASIVHGYYTTV